MEKVNRFFSSIVEACHPSKGTLSGAMDVIVIQRSDGTLYSTPFYVKFGRLKLVKTSNVVVSLRTNDQDAPIKMKLSKSGKAYFLHNVINIEDYKESSDEESEDDFPDLPPPALESRNSDFIAEELKSEPKLLKQKSNQFDGPIDSSINLTSDELMTLKLSPGFNRVQYVTETKKRVNLVGRIFLWTENEKVVISDIDGTLTKSDMRGHICYLMGKDWSRDGVVSLYNEISSRGYKILYLTSRSLSQVDSTLGLLSDMDQGGLKLPPGPILLSPDGMFTTIVREITNYSQEIKLKSLKELLNKFPEGKEPYWAGFGNRNGDAVAYHHAGIPSERIFIFLKKQKNECKTIHHFDDVAFNIDFHFPSLG